MTGAIAGAHMAGDSSARYDVVNTFFSEVFNDELKLHAWGESRFVHHRLIRGTPDIAAPNFAEIGIAADGRVSQVLAVGRADEHELFHQLVKRRLNATGREEQLKDPDVPLGSVMAD